MIFHLNFSRYIIFLLSLCLVTGCQSANTSMYDIGDYSRASILQNVSVGDQVRIRTVSGDSFDFEISSLGKNRLSGAEIIINYADIERLEVQRSKPVVTGDRNLLPYLIVGTLAVIAIMAMSNDKSGSSCTGSELMCNWASNLFR